MGSKKQFLAEMNCLLSEEKDGIAIEQINASEYCADNDVLKVLGNAYVRIGDYGAASEIFSYLTTLELSKEDEKWVAFNFAIILRLTNETDKAVSILKKILEQSINDPTYLCELGNCYFDKKEFDLAEECFYHAIEQIERTGKLNKPSIYCYAAWFFKETKQFQLAINLYKKALTYSPLNKAYLLHLADCYFELSEYKKAKEMYQKTRKYHPHDAMVQDYTTQMLESIGEV